MIYISARSKDTSGDLETQLKIQNKSFEIKPNKAALEDISS